MTTQKQYYAAGIADDGKPTPTGGFGAHWMRVVAVASRATAAYTAAKERLLIDGKSEQRVFCAPISAHEYREIGRALAAGKPYILSLPEAG